MSKQARKNQSQLKRIEPIEMFLADAMVMRQIEFLFCEDKQKVSPTPALASYSPFSSSLLYLILAEVPAMQPSAVSQCVLAGHAFILGSICPTLAPSQGIGPLAGTHARVMLHWLIISLWHKDKEGNSVLSAVTTQQALSSLGKDQVKFVSRILICLPGSLSQSGMENLRGYK